MREGRICRVCNPDSKLRDRIKVAWRVLQGRRPDTWRTMVTYTSGELDEIHAFPDVDVIAVDPYTWTPGQSTFSEMADHFDRQMKNKP